MYDALVIVFRDGDIVFGTDADITDAQHALKAAYEDVFRWRNGLTRNGRALNRKALARTTPIILQSGVTNRAMESLGPAVGDGIRAVRQGHAQGKPIPSPFNQTLMERNVTRRQDRDRVVGFREFMEGHSKFDPKLMGGRLGPNQGYSKLGSREADLQWIRENASAKPVIKAALVKSMDEGQPLQLINGGRRAPAADGLNGQRVDAVWDSIDWSAYPDFWDVVKGQALERVLSAKIWKRTSKAGLEYQTTVRQRTVHFLLDTFLNPGAMQAVVNKNTGNHGRSITSGELRWIYRNWGNPLVKANTSFWTRAGSHEAPWELPAYSALWQTYQPSNTDPAVITHPAAEAYEPVPLVDDFNDFL